MHQEIECPESEWGADYLAATLNEHMKWLRKAVMDRMLVKCEAAFWGLPVSYAMARKADADLSPGDACDALDRNAFGIEFYVTGGAK